MKDHTYHGEWRVGFAQGYLCKFFAAQKGMQMQGLVGCVVRRVGCAASLFSKRGTNEMAGGAWDLRRGCADFCSSI